jgi:Domain of unknown function (DUF4350)
MTTTPTTPSTDKPQSLALPIAGIFVAIVLIVAGALVAGRRDEQLPTAYGRRRGVDYSRSVNGTAVLADLFKRAGHRVTTFGRFSPKLEEADVIVWVASNFKAPTTEQREFLETWLAEGTEERTVVYIGRDYDAAVDYWESAISQVPPAQADEALRRQAEARAAAEAARAKMPAKEYARWFTMNRDAKPPKIDQLSGPWAEGIDAKQAALHLEGRLAIPQEADRNASDPKLPQKFETLLASGAGALVTRVVDDDWKAGQLLVVANGSFLLNYPLVNHEHRKLAAKLVAECGAPGRVVFIEGGPDGPAVLDKEPAGGIPNVLELLKVWPLNAILLHVTVLGIILCLARSPIFGRPRELPADSPTNFGKHVAALGQLLARSKDRHYAQARLAQYRQIAERRSGRTHLKHK